MRPSNEKESKLKNFEDLELIDPIQRALAEQRYIHPTPIQAKTIPPALEGLDVLGSAQTGTGKTAAFVLPILQYLANEQPPLQANRPSALVLAPTRELAIQISDSFRNYGKHIRFRQALVYGGVGQSTQVKSLRRGVDVLIATPGRLIDLMEQGHIQLEHVEQFVLDEADRMLDMGFAPDLKKIVLALPRERQSLFFSATLPPKIRELAAKFLFNPVSVTVASQSTTVDRIKQSVRFVQRADKLESLCERLAADGVERAIVFTRTKHGANGLAKKLDRCGIRATAIHGDKTQNARQRALQAFRRKRVKVLVATDVAARGIDVDGVTHVFNYDMPVDPESYVHRIGRTGRAGADGTAVSFCTADEMSELHAIEKLIGTCLEAENPNARFASRKPAAGKSGAKKKWGRRKAYRNGRPSAASEGASNGKKRRFHRSKKSGGPARAKNRRQKSPAA